MGSVTLDRLVDERDTQVAFVEQTLQQVEQQSRDLVDAELANLEAARQRIVELDSQIEPLQRFEQLRAAGQQLRRTVTTPTDPDPQPSTDGGSWGAVFLREVGVDYPGRGQSARHTIHTRAVITSGDVPGRPVQVPSLDVTHSTPLLDLLGRVTISSGSFEYVKTPGASPLAGIVAEGAQKPEADLQLQPVTGTLDTVAHYVLVTRQALEDHAQLRDLIDTELRQGVLDKMEAEAAAAVAGTEADPVSGDDLVQAVRVAMGHIGARGGRPNAVIINPVDYAQVDLHMLTLGGVAAAVAGTQPWGLRFVPAGAVPAGTAYVLDSRAVRVYQTSQVSTYITDSGYLGGKDLFTHNLFAILAEIRQKSVVLRDEFVVPVTAGG